MNHKIDKEKLLAYRNKQFWTQEDLATASGLSVRTIQRVESQGICSQETLKSLAAAFNISTNLLTTESINRRWLLGPIIGMLGGTIGCMFAYMAIFSEANLSGQSISDHWMMLIFVTFMMAFTILFPAYTIHKYWNYKYDPLQGNYCNPR